MDVTEPADESAWSGRARRRFATAGVLVAVAAVTGWFALPGKVLDRTETGVAIRNGDRLFDYIDCPLPLWIGLLGLVSVVAVLIATGTFVVGIVGACTDRDPLGRQALASVALIVLSVALAGAGVATVAVVFSGLATCGD